MFFYIQELLRAKWGEGTPGAHETTNAQGFYDLPNNSMDVLCVGSSQIFYNLSPLVMWEKYGFTSYVRGSANQTPLLSYYTIKDMLMTQNPQVIVFEVGRMVNSFNLSEDEWAARRGLDYMKLSPIKLEAVLALNEGKFPISYIFPLLRYHTRWKELSKTDFEYFSWDHHNWTKGQYMGISILDFEWPENYMQKNDKYAGMHRLGYLFDPFRNVEFDYMTRFTNEVLELMFLNGDGSVRGYYNKEGEIFPLFAEREFTCTCSKFIHWMQKSAMKFVGLYAGNWEVFEKLDISPEVMFQGYINFAVYPRWKTIRIFSKFRYRDEKIKPLVPNRSLLYYMTHSDKLKWDMENGCCKVFMMKKLFMFPLPYHKLLRFLVEKLHWKSEFRRTHFEVR